MSTSKVSRRRFLSTAMGVTVAAGVGLSACGGSGSSAQTSSSSDGGAASGQEPKAAILVTSFGTSYGSSRHITIGAIESDIREAFPAYDVRRAFTAQIVIDHVEKDTGRHINNFEEAMDQLAADGVKEVVVQPTHLMDGFEYNDVKKALEGYASKFDKTALGAPLLATDKDNEAVAKAIKEAMERYEDGQTAMCLMGHGTEAESNAVYTAMQKVFADLGYTNYFMCTVEAEPTFEDAVKAVTAAGFKKVVLRPFMVVAGDHANNDMADLSNPESLASVFTAAGVEVLNVIEGLGQLEAIDEIYVQHVQGAIDSIAK